MKNNKTWIIIGGITGFLGVALGAFGAHILEPKLSPEMIGIYNKGILYQLIHSVVILSIAFSGRNRFYKCALFFTIGIILFSFSLYLYSTTGVISFALITPVGGISFLAGWLLVLIEGFRLNKEEKTE
ncbi:MAG: DUF423 domain-containing protein [Ignavibacteriaceae bacterium]